MDNSFYLGISLCPQIDKSTLSDSITKGIEWTKWGELTDKKIRIESKERLTLIFYLRKRGGIVY